MPSESMGAPKGPQVHPDGPLISVDQKEREALKARRIKLELRQEDLAERAGCSPATISNLESGRSSQVRKKVYARIRRSLREPKVAISATDESDATFRKIVDDALDLTEKDLRVVAALIDSLKNPR